jgi:hypothetical protein
MRKINGLAMYDCFVGSFVGTLGEWCSFRVHDESCVVWDVGCLQISKKQESFLSFEMQKNGILL